MSDGQQGRYLNDADAFQIILQKLNQVEAATVINSTEIGALQKAITQMGTTLSSQLGALETQEAATAAQITTDMGTLATGISTILAALATALAGVTPGSQIQASDIANFTAVQTSLTTVDTQLQALIASAVVPAAPVVSGAVTP